MGSTYQSHLFCYITRRDRDAYFTQLRLMIGLFFALICMSSCNLQENQEGSSNPQLFRSGAVVSAHPLASKIGIDILKKGGNAFDAAIAVQFALAVVYPGAGNIGGGGFLVYRKDDGKKGALDFREKAPLAAHKEMFLDKKNRSPLLEKAQRGILSAGVPGSVAGMWAIHKKFAKLPWKELIAPSVALAENGFLLTEKEAQKYNHARESLIKYNGIKTDKKGTPIGDLSWIPLIKNKPWKKGDRVYMKDLATTLKRIQDQGAKGFYMGKTANLIERQMRKSGGIITKKDLKSYQAIWRTPILSQYKNINIISMPPPSSGGIALSQLCFGFETLNLAQYAHNSPEYLHLKTEIEKRVYADRARYLGDPDFFKVPTKKLLSHFYLKKRLANISLQKTTSSNKISSGNFSTVKNNKESEETTHFSIVDKDKNAVAITTTINRAFGSMVMVKGAGFLLNDEMDDFSIKPGTPNSFGLLGLGKANEIKAGKRMLSSMTPTILEKNNKLFMVLGTPGGATIITTVLQIMMNVIDHKMGAQQAVNMPRVHSQWMPDVIYIEKDYPLKKNSIERLQAYGHKIKYRDAMGRADVILVKRGFLETGADPRGDDSAAGY